MNYLTDFALFEDVLPLICVMQASFWCERRLKESG